MLNKHILVITSLVAGVALSAHADFLWSNGIETKITDQNNSALTSSASNRLGGCFAQLIKITDGSEAHTFTGSAQGVTGGDQVVNTQTAGWGWNPLLTGGLFFEQNQVADSDGYFYVRVFNTPQSTEDDFTSAIIPTTATHYWQSEVYSYSYSMSPESWDITTGSSSLQTTIAVPEPTTIAFLGLGMLLFFVRKKKRA